jgi:thymidylate synthase
MDAYIAKETVDDLMRKVIEAIDASGSRIQTSKGWCTEVTGILLELTNPLARLSRTETRGKLFSPLGELCWYLAQSKQLHFIEYYIPPYKDSAENGEIPGAYGPRLFNWNGVNQMANVAARFKKKPNTRRAAIQLFDAADIDVKHNDVPCTCTLQFLLREGKLNLIVYMRSNDAYLGLPHDIFCFTMLQEIVAREVSAQLGTYKHVVGSLHLYDRNREKAQQFLNEGFQPTTLFMPEMPAGDPWPAINLLLEAEQQIRTGEPYAESRLAQLDLYWADLIRLLLIFRATRDSDAARIKELRQAMASDYFRTFIDLKLAERHSSNPNLAKKDSQRD